MPGGSGENNHPGTNRTPPQTYKTAPRIDEQGKGKVFIPPDDSRPLQGQ
jgi:gp47